MAALLIATAHKLALIGTAIPLELPPWPAASTQSRPGSGSVALAPASTLPGRTGQPSLATALNCPKFTVEGSAVGLSAGLAARATG